MPCVSYADAVVLASLPQTWLVISELVRESVWRGCSLPEAAGYCRCLVSGLRFTLAAKGSRYTVALFHK
nr:MAG TPA: hypothetical protein [Caudoviricetes sp.]